MKKEYVIFIGAGILLLLVIGSGYQFYLKPTAEKLDQKKTEYRSYDTKLMDLEERYGGYVPEDVVSAWMLQLTPWYNTIDSRGELFGLGRVEFEEVPTNTLPKFHYAAQYEAMMEELRVEALEKGLYLPYLDLDVPTTQIENMTMTKEEVEEYLRQIAIGCNMVRLLLEHDPLEIQTVYLWPERVPAQRMKAVSVGYAFTARMSSVAELMDEICTQQRYASIDCFQIVNENLLVGADPPLMVEMVLTQATYTPMEQQSPEAILAQANDPTSEQSNILQMLRGQSSDDEDDEADYLRRKPPTKWQRFRKMYLPF